MKTYKIIVLVFLLVVLQSCYESASLKIQNNISGVKIEDVSYGGIEIAYDLLPGETSSKKLVNEQKKHFPFCKKITFIMVANNKSIYLETDEEYVLDKDDDLLIIIDDSTKVSNPTE